MQACKHDYLHTTYKYGYKFFIHNVFKICLLPTTTPCVLKFLLEEFPKRILWTLWTLHFDICNSQKYLWGRRPNWKPHPREQSQQARLHSHQSIQLLRPILLDEKNALDFTFYEICTVTVFVNFALKDNTFRIFYSTYTRDAHRGRDHATFLLICKQHPEKVISLRYVTDLQGSYRTFVLHLKQDGQNSQSAEIEWFFICFYCTNIYHMVRYTDKIKGLTISMLQEDWRPRMRIAVDLGRNLWKVYHVPKGNTMWHTRAKNVIPRRLNI